jgi:hypothetical protein
MSGDQPPAEHQPGMQYSRQGGTYVIQWCRQCGSAREWVHGEWKRWGARVCRAAPPPAPDEARRAEIRRGIG